MIIKKTYRNPPKPAYVSACMPIYVGKPPRRSVWKSFWRSAWEVVVTISKAIWTVLSWIVAVFIVISLMFTINDIVCGRSRKG